MNKKILPLLFVILFSQSVSAQPEKKRINAVAISDAPKIDGILDDECWKNVPAATDFLQRTPYNGKPATQRTEVKFVYDNSGLYVGAMMYDPYPDSILTQLGLRDAGGLNADFFAIGVSPFNDGINAFCFLVYASDVQVDFKLPGGNQFQEGDFTWDAVWQSKARMNETGWVVEMKIPYSAVRFPKMAVQSWAMNCERDVRRTRERSSWNFVDAKIEGVVNQAGILDSLVDIRPPLRLSVTPYVSGYMEKSPDNPDWAFSYNFGADLKYGINQSFTLDMTLIPDFGQVPSDDKIYNFSPFEIWYDEKRQFFTEGTELFNKSGIFYSRRIGDQPVDYNEAYNKPDTGEIVDNNPMQVKLLNATKVSGRTNKGLGIGVFNAMSGNTWATIRDTVTGETRKFLTQGFTNYNMVVFDQALKNNSYFDVLNTNYYIPDKGYCANVSGIDFKLANKKYTYALSGNGFISQKYMNDNSPELGYHYDLEFGKISGNFQFSYQQLLETDTYDPNDMGFNGRNNKFNNGLSLEYNIYEPFGKFLSMDNGLVFSYNCLYDGFKYMSFNIQGASHFKTRKYFDFGLNFNLIPVPHDDYYEPRVDGYMYIQPAEYDATFWISTDYRKTVAVDAFLSGYHASRNCSDGLGIKVSPRLRASDRLFFIYDLSFEEIVNNIGYVDDYPDSTGRQVILFGKRDIRTITNVLNANYMITSKMSIDFRLRHYWTTAEYDEFYTMNQDGTLAPTGYQEGKDINFNQFNIDMSYIWNFAPGSQLSFVWKNAINTFTNLVNDNFIDNFNSTINSPASNSFSVRVLYYLDALYFKKKTRK